MLSDPESYPPSILDAMEGTSENMEERDVLFDCAHEQKDHICGPRRPTP